MKQISKARQLMQIAFATYRRNEPEIAKDIFVLAMEDASAASEFGGKASRESLRQKMREAIAAGDYDEAANYLEAMEGEDEGEFIEEEPVGEGEEAEGTDEMPPPDLAPAQVASLVTLARKIRADGHPDLAKRITQALGL